jgi:hypothetical protein
MGQYLSGREWGMNFAAFAAYAWFYPNNFEILYARLMSYPLL